MIVSTSMDKTSDGPPTLLADAEMLSETLCRGMDL